MNVIRIAVQRRAVVNVAQGIKDVRIDAILNTVDRSIGEDGVDPGRVSRAELIRRRPTDSTPSIYVYVNVRIGS
jgi:hypothetical protein